jgi:hypothetical protein
MLKLKAVIFGLRDVILHKGQLDSKLWLELGRLLQLIQSRGITPVFLANRPWAFVDKDGNSTDAEAVITAQWGNFPWYVANRDNLPRKPTKEATAHILEEHGWRPEEVIYVGNTEDDMRTAVNGGLLFLNAKWHADANQYGFDFETPKAIGRFIDVFCTRDSLWYFKIEDGPLRVYAMGLFSSYDQAARTYTDDAKSAAKFGGGTVPFWKQYLVSTLYLSGICSEFDYLAPYPGHSTTSGVPVTHDDMVTLTKCFRTTYLPDLVVRHKTALKSQHARQQGKVLDVRNQLETIRPTRLPLRGGSGKRYKSSPLGRGKTVLVLDDILTEGYSLDAARNFIQQTGARVILVAWLKTLNRPYYRHELAARFDPYSPQSFSCVPQARTYDYSAHIVDRNAPKDIGASLEAYKKWDWPKNA